MSKNSLLKKIAKGDHNAVEKLIDVYGGLVLSIAQRYFSVRQDAEDAVQDTFISIWKSAERYSSKAGTEKAFITMIARRRIIDRFRKLGRHQNKQNIDSTSEPATQQSDSLVKNEQITAILEAIEQLDPPQPEVIRISIIDGLSHSQIAEKLSIPLGTVKTHIRRGLNCVRNIIASQGDREVAI